MQEPEELEKGVEVVTATRDIEKAHGVHPVHIETGFKETKEEVNILTITFTHYASSYQHTHNTSNC